MLDYYTRLEELNWDFVAAISESLGLPPEALHSLFANDPKLLQPRAKLIRYPADLPGLKGSGWGINAHVDKSVLTYLLQVTDQPCLQVLNHFGDWVTAPPIPGTFVVNLGRALERVTQRAVIATVHRVISPEIVRMYMLLHIGNPNRQEQKFEFPREVLDLKRARQERTGESQEFHYSDEDKRVAGEAVLDEKVKMHPLSALRFYPELCHGLPAYLRDEEYPAMRECPMP